MIHGIENDLHTGDSSRAFDRRWIIISIVMLLASTLCAGIAIAKTCKTWEYLNDDFYITYTFARNIAEGRGFVYNGGMPILGTTTPLLALGLAIGNWLMPSVPIPVVAICLGGMAWIISNWVFFYWQMSSGLDPFVATLTACVNMLWGAGGWTKAWLGGEYPLFFALLLITIYLVTRQHDWVAGLFIAGLFLVRGEGILVLPIVFLYRLGLRRKLPIPLLLGFAVPFMLWCIYSFARFGALVPSTLAAKLIQRASGLWPSIRIGGPTSIQLQIGSTMSIVPGLPLLTSAWFALPGIGVLIIKSSCRSLLMLVFFVLAALGAYWIMNVAWYPWYTLNLALTIRLLAVLGASWIVTRLLRKSVSRSLIAHIIRQGICVGILVLILVPVARSFATIWLELEALRDYRSTPYRAAAGWLNNHSSKGDSVAYIEIGYLGYFTRLQVVDLGGLVTPVALQRLGQQDLGIWLLAREQPQFVIYWPGFRDITGEFTSAMQFIQDYEYVAGIPTPTEMSDQLPLQIWRRRRSATTLPAVDFCSRNWDQIAKSTVLCP